MIKCVSRGLSLAEVVLAVGLLTIIAITVAGVFTHLLSASAKTSDVSAGRSLARRILDSAVRRGPDVNGNFPFYEDDITLITQATQTQTVFHYRVQPNEIKVLDDFGGARRYLYLIEVEVTWWGYDSADPTTHRAEMGKLSTELSQVAGYER